VRFNPKQKGRLRQGGRKRVTTVNALGCKPENVRRQLRPHDELRGALVANAQLKLHLRLLRANTAGSHRRAAITRLLAVGEAVDRSLSWLPGSPDEPCRASAADGELAELGQLVQLAMDAAATPEAVGVSQ
jgi:hypothetical protein